MVDCTNWVIIDYNFEVLLQLERFESCNEYLKNFIYDEDLVSSSNRHGNTKLLIDSESKEFIGYYTICASAISLNRDNSYNQNYYNEIRDYNQDLLIKYAGAIGISCFAVNDKYRSEYTIVDNNEIKVSHYLLEEAFEDIRDAARILGTKFVILTSTDEGRGLYHDFGFEFLDYEHKYNYYIHKNIEYTGPSEEELRRKDKYVLNINSEDIGCYPMMMNI
ncbi:hypothetical protein [Clostridium sp.]|uniref:hypothetical protein n=1 Tax=Clostridium sp. TaxID=1506 RepID=UPI001B45A6E9|nr:hypothetical protein [Clostridium sp.]MBP3916979.1 hypothetical protein [Clostridium sp.]